MDIVPKWCIDKSGVDNGLSRGVRCYGKALAKIACAVKMNPKIYIPARTVGIPPNHCSPQRPFSFLQSRKKRSTVSRAYLFCIGASSHIISFVQRMSCPSWLLTVALHVLSVLTKRGILNREGDVLPPCRRTAAIPDEATARATKPMDRTLLRIMFSRNVFPIPPAPSK